MGLFGLPDGKSTADKNAARTRRRENGAKLLRYSHLPGIFPRVRAIGQKFGHFAYMLAQVFASTKLIPANHPMLNPVNIGRFGITDVIATAANGLVLKRENMDQILVFCSVVMALLMIVVQVAAITIYQFFGSAQAADSSMFLTPNPSTDVVSKFLGQVFGFQTIFQSSGAVEQPGLYAVLGFYSTAMMVFAVLIVVYYVITVVGESAQTGQPFGKRFNGLWAPIRLVLALGLLVPLGGGINAAQYLVLYTAKFGSGLATQGWITFTKNFAKPDALISSMSAAPAQDVASQIFAAEACRTAFNIAHKGTNPVYIRVNAGNKSAVATFGAADIQFAQAQGASSLAYVWTRQARSSDAAAPAVCGAVTVPVRAAPSRVQSNQIMNLTNTMVTGLQNAYVQAIGSMVTSLSGSAEAPFTADTTTFKFVCSTMTLNDCRTGASAHQTNSAAGANEAAARELASAIDRMQESMNSALQSVNDALRGDNPYYDSIHQQMQRDASERGWGTAGIYYLEMAKFTQMVLDTASNAAPTPGQRARPEDFNNAGFFTGRAGRDADRQVRTSMENVPAVINTALGQTTIQQQSNAAQNSVRDIASNADILSDPLLFMARWLFGDAFFIMFDTPTLNPMGALINGGQSILQKTKDLFTYYIVAVAGSVLGTVGSAVLGGLGGAAAGAAATSATGPGAILGAGGGFFVGAGVAAAFASIAKVAAGVIWFFMLLGAGAGIVLFYLLPLLPFMYFFFSVVNWVIEVAEAFVSMPLFALSHLRIDGEGLLPQRALDNWITLFGILLRPLMIVMGMIVGSLVFNAGAYYLTSTFKFAIYAYNTDAQNAAGAMDFTKVGGFGIITYILLYVYMVYLLATSSFKLIDQIPDKMLRWIGGPTPFTGDRPVDLGAMQNTALMGYLAAKEGGGAINNSVNQIQQGIGNLGKGGGKGPPGKGPTAG